MSSFVDLDGASAVVTGAGSGIGRATALELARRGARVVVSDVVEARAQSVASEIATTGGRAVGLVCDVRRDHDLERLRDTCIETFGRVDVVMNNVGVLAMGPPESVPIEAWQRVLDINVLGVVRSNLVFLPLLLAQGHGHVVNTASLSGLLAHGYDRLAYVTAKHAIVGLSESLALYLRPRGIGVTCFCPAGVRTNIVEQIDFYGEPSTPRAPDYPMVDADEAARMLVDAIEAGDFLALTTPSALDEMRERVADIEAYLIHYQEASW